MSIEDLDNYVNWMRKRAVGTLVMDGLQIHLGTLEEPSAVKPHEERKTDRTPEEQRDLERFGALPRRIERAK